MSNQGNKKGNNGKAREFAPSFGFWPSKSGTSYTVLVTEQLLETLQKAQAGGRLLLQAVPEEKREENDRLPHYRVTIFAPDEQKAASASDSI